LNVRPFLSFFSTAFGFGTIALDDRAINIRMIEGELPVEKLVLTVGGKTSLTDWNATARTNAPAIKSI
jgi:hypothetical protein